MKVIPYKFYFHPPYRIFTNNDERLSNINFEKHHLKKMTKVENDLDIYYEVGNANTQRQENELAAIMKKRNSAGWKLISTSTAIVDTKNLFSNLYLFWEKK